jgi:hypothetical protein
MYFVGQAPAPSQEVMQGAVNGAIAGDDAKLAYVISLERFTDGEGALNFGDLLLRLRSAVGSDRFERVFATLPNETSENALGCMKAAEEARHVHEAPRKT